ncbi:hypothetical protein [Calothrix sp. NIES-2098]|uniref:hypothetical protein n=1 Tax=Calothrix sp. NIES-2098 TaxID=1954171 RepID=UPI000B610A7C|nr:hypothetical protein NIES2098_05160 [Calothrix sp. NIES-2098]
MAKSDSVINETVTGFLQDTKKNWSNPCHGDRPNTDTMTKIPQAVWILLIDFDRRSQLILHQAP